MATNTMQEAKSTYRPPKSESARRNRNAYQRRYRQEHPEKAQLWRQNYILKAAAALQAENREGAL